MEAAMKFAGYFGSAAVGAFGLWFANRLLGKAAFQEAINNGFSSLLHTLQTERDGLEAEVHALRSDLAKKELQHQIDRDEMRGEIRQLGQMIESLKNHIVRHGLELPDEHHATN
jgi:hypothetical protein